MDSKISAKLSIASGYKPTHRSSSDLIDTAVTIPPDGGWGWVIVVVSFLVNFFIDGALYTFGIFLQDIANTFQVEPTKVAVASSLMTGFCFMSGPLACAVINHWGFQITGVLGGLFAATAYFISSLQVSNVPFITILGIIGGVGFGLAYVPSIVIIGFYFNRWRSLATSIAATGSALGMLGFPLLVKSVLSAYDWRIQFRIIGSTYIVTSILALSYRSLKPIYVQVKTEKKAAQYLAESIAEIDPTYSRHLMKKPGFFNRLFNRFHNITYPTASQIHRDSTIIINLSSSSSSSLFLSTSPLEGSASVSVEFVPSAIESFRMEGKFSKLERLSTVYENEQPSRFGGCCKNCCKKCFQRGHQTRPMYRDDIFYTGPTLVPPTTSVISSITMNPQLSQNQGQVDKIKSAVEYHLSVTRVAIKDKDTERIYCGCCPESVLRTLVTMLDLSLLKSPSFLLLALSGTFSTLGIYVPFIYLIQKAAECGIEENVSLRFFTALGISNAVGRLCSGVISSIPQVKPLIISYITILICGLTIIAFYFICSVSGHFVCIAIIGFMMASLATLRAPIVVDLLGLEALTNAFGIILLFQGIAAFCGLPVAGGVVKMTGNSYHAAFVFSGGVISLSAILLIPIKIISNWEKRRFNRISANNKR